MSRKKNVSNAAAELGRLGGHARKKKQTPEALSEQGRKAAKARWAKRKPGAKWGKRH